MSAAVISPPAPERHSPLGRPAADSWATAARYASGAALVAMTVLVPAGPGNTGPADAFIMTAIGVTAFAVLVRAVPLRLPYVVPVLLFMLAGGLGGLSHGRPTSTVLGLAQDLVLLLWVVTLASAARDPVALRGLLRVWAASAAVWAGVLVAAVVLGLDGLAGVSEEEGERTSFTFGDPNRAGSYFAVSFFVLLAVGSPRHRMVTWIAAGFMLAALGFTGSNAAILSLLAGLILGALVAVVRRFGWLPSIAAVALAAAVLIALLSLVDVGAVQQRAKDSGRLLANSVARSVEGGADRRLLFGENLDLYRSGAGGLFGTGPGGTKALLAERQASYVKEAHNDWLAALLERGPLGLLALGVFASVVGVVAVQMCSATAGPMWHPAFGRVQWLAAAALSIGVYGWFHEALHFRHVWALLGLLAAAGALIKRGSRARSEA